MTNNHQITRLEHLMGKALEDIRIHDRSVDFIVKYDSKIYEFKFTHYYGATFEVAVVHGNYKDLLNKQIKIASYIELEYPTKSSYDVVFKLEAVDGCYLNIKWKNAHNRHYDKLHLVVNKHYTTKFDPLCSWINQDFEESITKSIHLMTNELNWCCTKIYCTYDNVFVMHFHLIKSTQSVWKLDSYCEVSIKKLVPDASWNEYPLRNCTVSYKFTNI